MIRYNTNGNCIITSTNGQSILIVIDGKEIAEIQKVDECLQVSLIDDVGYYESKYNFKDLCETGIVSKEELLRQYLKREVEHQCEIGRLKTTIHDMKQGPILQALVDLPAEVENEIPF